MFNKEDKIKWNDLSRSLQDIIMRRMTWKMLHPSLQKWLLHLEARVTELERNLYYMWHGQQGQVAKVDIAGKYLYPSDNFFINGATISLTEQNETHLGDGNLDIYRLDLNRVYPAEDYSTSTYHQIDDHENRVLMYNPVLEHLYYYTQKNIYIKLFPYLDVLRLILYKLWADGKQGQVVKIDKEDNTLYPHNNFIDSEDIVDEYDVDVQGHTGTYNVKTTSTHKVVNDKLDTDVKTTNRILLYNPKWEHLFWGLKPQSKEKLFPYLDVLRDEILHRLWAKGEDGQLPKIELKASTYSKVHNKGILFPHDNFVVTKDVTIKNANKTLKANLATGSATLHGAPVVKDDTDKVDDTGVISESGTDFLVLSNITTGGPGANRILIYNPKEEEMFWYQKENHYTILFKSLCDLKNALKNMFANGKMGQVMKINPDEKKLYAHNNFIDSEGIVDEYDVDVQGHTGTYNVKTTSNHKKVNDVLDGEVETTNRILLYNPKWEHLFWGLEPKKKEKLFPYLDVLRDEILYELWAKGEEGQVPKIKQKSSTYSKVHNKGVLIPHDEVLITGAVTKDNFQNVLKNPPNNYGGAMTSKNNTIAQRGPGSNRILLYNPDDETMYWYEKPGKYTRMFPSMKIDDGEPKKPSLGIVPDGKLGQVTKINPSNPLESRLYPHDEALVIGIPVIDDDKYLSLYDGTSTSTSITTTTEDWSVSTKEIATTWDKCAYFDETAVSAVDNSDQDAGEGNTIEGWISREKSDGWTYDASKKYVKHNYNSPIVSGLYHKGVADNYDIEMLIDNNWDDDNFFIILGMTKDSNGDEHTLTLVRGNGNAMIDLYFSHKFFENYWTKDDLEGLEDNSDIMNAWRDYYNPNASGLASDAIPSIPSNGKFYDSRNKIRNAILNAGYSDFTDGSKLVDTLFYWGIIYDFGQSTQNLVDARSYGEDEFFNASSKYPGPWPCQWCDLTAAKRDSIYYKYIFGEPKKDVHGNKVKMEVVKTTDESGNVSFACTTTDWSLDETHLSYISGSLITVDENWINSRDASDDERENMRAMLKSGVVGVGCRSCQGYFKIIKGDGEFFKTVEVPESKPALGSYVYALHRPKGKVLVYGNGSWSEKCDLEVDPYGDDITRRIFMYNESLSRLYWYIEPGVYRQLFGSWWDRIEVLEKSNEGGPWATKEEVDAIKKAIKELVDGGPYATDEEVKALKLAITELSTISGGGGDSYDDTWVRGQIKAIWEYLEGLDTGGGGGSGGGGGGDSGGGDSGGGGTTVIIDETSPLKYIVQVDDHMNNYNSYVPAADEQFTVFYLNRTFKNFVSKDNAGKLSQGSAFRVVGTYTLEVGFTLANDGATYYIFVPIGPLLRDGNAAVGENYDIQTASMQIYGSSNSSDRSVLFYDAMGGLPAATSGGPNWAFARIPVTRTDSKQSVSVSIDMGAYIKSFTGNGSDYPRKEISQLKTEFQPYNYYGVGEPTGDITFQDVQSLQPYVKIKGVNPDGTLPGYD